jgi:hypothetical protein
MCDNGPKFFKEAPETTPKIIAMKRAGRKTWTISTPIIQPKAPRVIMGPPGEMGIEGPIGPRGLQGIKGMDGETGPEGPMGPRGIPGIQGEMGFKGDKGDTGPEGQKGDKGDTGQEGPRGIPGILGLPGPQGATGPRGLEGPEGPEGPRGIPGILGLPGPKGDKGDDAYICYWDEKTQTINVAPPSSERVFGKSSVYVGKESGFTDTSEENTYVGNYTGITQSGGLNSYFGFNAGKFSTGTQNSYFGNNVCAESDSAGSYNLFAGAEAGFANKSGFGNVFLGAMAGSANTEGCWNVFAGQGAGNANQVGTNCVFIGTNAGANSVAGNSCIIIGDSAETSSATPVNQVVIGQGVTSFGDNTITFPNNLRTLPSGTEVGFSSSNGGCLFPVSSSIRWKNNVKDISEVLNTEDVFKLRPVTFNPAEGHGDVDELCVGLIAEEVEKYFPVLVPKDDLGRPSSVKYSLLCVFLLEELKKMKKEIADIKAKM